MRDFHSDMALEVVGGVAQVCRRIAENDFPRSAETFNAMRGEQSALTGCSLRWM